MPTVSGPTSPSSRRCSASPTGSSTQPMVRRRAGPRRRRGGPCRPRPRRCRRSGRRRARRGASRGRSRPAAATASSDLHAARAVGLAAVQDPAAEADPGRAQPVHLDARARTRRPAPTRAGRPATVARPGRSRAGAASLTSPAAVSSAVSAPMVLRLRPSSAGELRPGGRAVHVHVPQQGPEVVPAYLLLAGAGSHQRAVPVPRSSFIGCRWRPLCAGTARRRSPRPAGSGRSRCTWCRTLKPIRPMPLSMTAITAPPMHRVDHLALAAEEAGAADDGRADRVQQDVAAAGVRVDRVGPADREDAADGRHERADHERPRCGSGRPGYRRGGPPRCCRRPRRRAGRTWCGRSTNVQMIRKHRDDRDDDRHALHRDDQPG